MTIKSTKIIYDNLKNIGLTRAQVRKILPNWWTPEAEKSPDGIAEFCVLISRRLNLDLVSLMNGEVGINGAATAVAYKHRADASPQSLQASTCIATSLAQAVVASISKPYDGFSSSPAHFSALCRENGGGVVSLSTLINTCWTVGVPVIPIPNLPLGIRKMDGAVIKVGDRPVIIISKKKSSRAWLSFILSHEIGHIGCGHLGKGGSIIDVSLQEQATYESESSGDVQEREADAFALAVLGGDAVDKVIGDWPVWSSPVDLAVRAKESAPLLGVESGHLVLRYAFKTKRWPDAMTALRFLSEDAGAEEVMKTALIANVDLDLVSDDVRDLVCQVTGIDRC